MRRRLPALTAAPTDRTLAREKDDDLASIYPPVCEAPHMSVDRVGSIIP
jgi:hypothetical protein